MPVSPHDSCGRSSWTPGGRIWITGIPASVASTPPLDPQLKTQSTPRSVFSRVRPLDQPCFDLWKFLEHLPQDRVVRGAGMQFDRELRVGPTSHDRQDGAKHFGIRPRIESERHGVGPIVAGRHRREQEEVRLVRRLAARPAGWPRSGWSWQIERAADRGAESRSRGFAPPERPSGSIARGKIRPRPGSGRPPTGQSRNGSRAQPCWTTIDAVPWYRAIATAARPSGVASSSRISTSGATR